MNSYYLAGIGCYCIAALLAAYLSLSICFGWRRPTNIDKIAQKLKDGIHALEDQNASLQAENESLANYRRLWEAAALELRAANTKIAKLEKVPKKVKK